MDRKGVSSVFSDRVKDLLQYMSVLSEDSTDAAPGLIGVF